MRLAQVAREAREATAGERVLAVDAGTAVTRIGLAVVDVGLAGRSGESGRTFARVLGDGVVADATVATR